MNFVNLRRTVVLFLPLVLSLLVACNKTDSIAIQTPSAGGSKPASAPDASGTQAAAPTPPPVNAATLAEAAEHAPASTAPDMEKLAAAVQGYYKEYGIKPGGFEQIVRSGYLAKEPEAPAGKKFVIDPQTMKISLVNK